METKISEENNAGIDFEKIMASIPNVRHPDPVYGPVIARDEVGNTFTKDVSFRDGQYGVIVSLGFPVEYYVEDLLAHPPQDGDKLWLDAMGRNHKGSPVWCSFAEVINIYHAYKAENDKENTLLPTSDADPELQSAEQQSLSLKL